MYLPNCDGAKGKASRFISDFFENIEAHRYDESQWKLLEKSGSGFFHN